MTEKKNDDTAVITIHGKKYLLKGSQVFDEDGIIVDPEEQRRTLAGFIQEATADEWRGLAQFIKEATADTLADTMTNAEATLDEVRDEIQATADKGAAILERIANAGPYLDEELKKNNGASLKTLFVNCSLADLANEKDPRTALLLQALDAAEKRKKNARGPYITENQARRLTSDPIPELLAIITRPEYKGALLAKSIFKTPQGVEVDKKSGRLKLPGAISHKYDERGNLLLTANTGTEEESTVMLVNVKNDTESIDLPNLSLIFSIIERHIKRQLENNETPTTYVRIDAYELAEDLGTSRTKGKEAIKAAQNAIYNLVGYVGVVQNEKAPGVPNEYTLINYWGTHNNQIVIESPYFGYLLGEIYKKSIRRDERGRIKRKTTGEPLFEPYASYLVHADIVKERDRAAIENVKILMQLIETAGSFTPHISIRELINRNSLLAYKIENAKDTRTKNTYLKRVFGNTWKYIHKDTDLLERYNGIKLPENYVPIIQNLDYVLEFPNSGKKHAARR